MEAKQKEVNAQQWCLNLYPVSLHRSGFFLSMADHHSKVLSIFWEHGKLLIKPAFCTVFRPRRMERLTIVSSPDMKSNEFQWSSARIHDLCVGLCLVCGRERYSWSPIFALRGVASDGHGQCSLLNCVSFQNQSTGVHHYSVVSDRLRVVLQRHMHNRLRIIMHNKCT